ncbi:alkaline phosphatase family protein [cf. Phormidesmis sp. LEGE 11477]|uniref:alkaline phosphatase family protein n=1 Tax=cf. Phormidesmis sp. LEGE 11477 TaxID=1828680 RepID=UPI001882F79D|nr:alkaline phosphatase family protein [cf. Phormidesmis sp. LEGE 11477]MBE9064596.1 alkaline phosphatase family protein [cf. Phormidesmis sp. LEGE 11477]
MDDAKSVLSSSNASFLLVFLDGVGLGQASKNNPLCASAATPFLEEYLGQKLLEGASAQSSQTYPNLLLKPIDATLGVEGLPQSATGQTTIYTGRNAPKFLGRHQSGFANGSLRQLIDQYGLFAQVMALGKTATLANAYSPEYFYAIARRKRRYSVCTLLNLSAGLPFRMQYEYDQGEAVSWNIIGAVRSARDAKTLRQTGARKTISPAVAGKRLAQLSRRYHVTLFECYLTDYAGHAQDWDQAVAALQRVDACIAGAIAHRPPNVTLLVTSDHGNVEDLSTKRHTFNQVPLIAIGPHAAAFSQIEDLTGITPQILSLL